MQSLTFRKELRTLDGSGLRIVPTEEVVVEIALDGIRTSMSISMDHALEFSTDLTAAVTAWKKGDPPPLRPSAYISFNGLSDFATGIA